MGQRDTLLSREIGRRVTTYDGALLGRVVDMTVALGPDRPPVRRLLVGAGRSTGYVVPAGVVERVADHLVVGAGVDVDALRADLRRPPLEADEVLLARDVMDTQVVDLLGHHLSRVSDVLLEDGDERLAPLEVVAVDLGTAGLLRRLGLGLLAGGSVVAVEWRHLHLTSTRGHAVQLTTDEAGFRRLDPHGLAELLTRLSTPRATDVIRAIDPAHAAAAIHHSHPRAGRRLVHALSSDERARLVAHATDEHARTITRLGRPTSPAHHRRYRRTAGWRLHRPPEA
jgi:sporulation protein YlmC with PRC-barrel domain